MFSPNTYKPGTAILPCLFQTAISVSKGKLCSATPAHSIPVMTPCPVYFSPHVNTGWFCSVTTTMPFSISDPHACKCRMVLQCYSCTEYPGTATVPCPGQQLWATAYNHCSIRCCPLPVGCRINYMYSLQCSLQCNTLYQCPCFPCSLQYNTMRCTVQSVVQFSNVNYMCSLYCSLYYLCSLQ